MEEVTIELLWGLQWEEDTWHNTYVSTSEMGSSFLYACGPSPWLGQALALCPLWTRDARLAWVRAAQCGGGGESGIWSRTVVFASLTERH